VLRQGLIQWASLVETVMIAMSCTADDKRRRGRAPFARGAASSPNGAPFCRL
jgi:hypothetical protein